MSTQDIANDLVALCKDGKFDEAGEKYWAANHEVHSSEVEGPYVNGDQFAVRFKMDLTQKASGERMTMDEVGVYTVRDGKIAEERFFY